ncbi:MAG TPA: preprotein translocase subunit SecE [Tenuifilaceae bacterium]|nr:preprotein translocase subunit SecE [Tenuifilaceae bacterium]HPI45759.1 preprotein translocase subunit SecE [Tenuifilaceae bacterium]
MMKITQYFHEVYTEMVQKVSWPTWKELQSSALIVMIASLLIALVVFVMDISFENMMKVIYRMLN